MQILPVWERCRKIPGGALLFNLFMRYIVPYTGSLGARVKSLNAGDVVLTLRQRRAVENHLNSIHAVALMNLCEATSGLAVITALPPKTKAILVKFQIEYLKKARGVLVSRSQTKLPPITTRTSHLVEVAVFNENQDKVCFAQATWVIDPLTS